MVVFSLRGGIGILVETDGTLFAKGMLDEVNLTLKNRDNRQQKIVAELVAVRGNSMVASDFLGGEAFSAATLNSGDQRLLTLVMDTAGLDADAGYKVGVMIYRNENSTEFPVRGSLLAVAHVADIEICNPVEVINSNMSLCNEISIQSYESDQTIP
ncbi:MAG: hypothetical protein HXS50_02130 [Theionarchaea archaeon]|nr:hypothetical protein [Theionarchaea archaeon]